MHTIQLTNEERITALKAVIALRYDTTIEEVLSDILDSLQAKLEKVGNRSDAFAMPEYDVYGVPRNRGEE